MEKWTNVGHLRRGDRIEDPNGSTVRVSGVERSKSQRGERTVTVTGYRDGQNDYARVFPASLAVKRIG